jgi:hypothetical protein
VKKVLLLVLIVFSFAGVTYFFVRPYFNFDSGSKVRGVAVNNESIKELPTNNSKIGSITEKDVFDYWIDKNTGLIYYIKNSGEIFKLNPGREAEQISSINFANISGIKPSSDGSMVLLEIDYPKSEFKIFNILAKSWRSLPDGVSSASWSPEENKKELAYLQTIGSGENQEKKIGIFKIESNESIELADFNYLDLVIEWKDKNKLYLKTRPSDLIINSVFSFDINEKTITRIISETLGLVVNWADSGSLAIASEFNQDKIKIIDNTGEIIGEPDINTLAEKCTVNGQDIFCAEFTTPIKLLDSYMKKEVYSKDNLVLFNLKNNEKKILLDSEELGGLIIDAKNLEYFNNSLYFINRYDSRLYKANL